LTSPLYHVSNAIAYYLSKLLGLAQFISDRTGLSIQTSALQPTNLTGFAVNPQKERLKRQIQDSFVTYPNQIESLYEYFETFVEVFTGISEEQFLALNRETPVTSNVGTLKEEFSKGISQLPKTIFKILNTEIKVPEIDLTKLLHYSFDAGFIGLGSFVASKYKIPSLVNFAYSVARQRDISHAVVKEKSDSPTFQREMSKVSTSQLFKLPSQWTVNILIEGVLGFFINDKTVSSETLGNLKALASNAVKIPVTHFFLTPWALKTEEWLKKSNLEPLMKIPKWLRDYLISPKIEEAINKLELEPRFRSVEINLLKNRK